MDVQELEKRIQKCSFILKTMISRWESLGNGAEETTSFKMLLEALDMLEGRFHEYEVINVDVDDKTFLQIAHMAHEKDITLNQMVEMSLRLQVDKILAEQEDENSEEE